MTDFPPRLQQPSSFFDPHRPCFPFLNVMTFSVFFLFLSHDLWRRRFETAMVTCEIIDAFCPGALIASSRFSARRFNCRA